jgi:hypothetical protein
LRPVRAACSTGSSQYYIKVTEYQRRGLVHIHVVMRLDRAMPKYRDDELRAPDRRFTDERLEQAIRLMASELTAPTPGGDPDERVSWGREVGVRRLDREERREVAGYLAKYSTKSTEVAGVVLHRVTEGQVDELPVTPHVRGLLRAGFTLDGDGEHDDCRLARYAHTFGNRGHCLTKSRRYSTTFKALRQAREQHVHEQLLKRPPDAAQRELAAAAAAGQRVAHLKFHGQGRRVPRRHGGCERTGEPNRGPRGAGNGVEIGGSDGLGRG